MSAEEPWCSSIQSLSFPPFSAETGGGEDVGGSVGDDLAGQEHVFVGVPEEVRLSLVGLLEILGKSSGRIPRSSQACSDRNKEKIFSDT